MKVCDVCKKPEDDFENPVVSRLVMLTPRYSPHYPEPQNLGIDLRAELDLHASCAQQVGLAIKEAAKEQTGVDMVFRA